MALALAPACRVVTAVEVETRVEADGSGSRSVRVQSRWEDGRDEEAAFPADFLPPVSGYSAQVSEPARMVASASFARLDQAPAPFAFGNAARRTGFVTKFRAVDWGLFRMIHYEESVVDQADPDDLRTALEECAMTLLDAADSACARVFGTDFDATLLHERLRGDFRAVVRDVVFTIWQELYAGRGDLDTLLARALPRFQPLGLTLTPADFKDNEEGFPSLRRALTLWTEAQLRSRKQGERTPQPVGLESVLFEGAFAEAFVAALDARFGSAAGREEWWKAMEPRLKGSFGAGRDDLSFRLRVRMPGTLLRSDGWLEPDGASFLEFVAHEAFPRGRGIHCASVVWDATSLSALPAAGLLPDNAAAISWTSVIGDGPDAAPEEALLGLLRACVAARSLQVLKDAAADEQQPELATSAARMLAWLNGTRE